MRDSQLVVTTTPGARALILKAAWLHPGLHITAMGSDQAEQERDRAGGDRRRRPLRLRPRQPERKRLGELRSGARSRPSRRHDPPELGEVIAGTKPGRKSDKDVTICDLTGTGAQDTAIATYAFAAARKAGSGTIIQA